MATTTQKNADPDQSELEKTRETLRLTKKYLAKAKKDLADLAVNVEAYKQESWVTTRARKRRERRQKLLKRERDREEAQAEDRRRTRQQLKELGEWVTPSPTTSEADRNAQNRLISEQMRLASYKDRIRRTSAQLLIASAVGYQWRETTVAMQSGKLVPGADPAIPRYYRAFENRRTSSLSSTEFTARAFKNWINREKDLRGRSRSRSPSTVRMSSRSSTTTSSSSGDSGFGFGNIFGNPSSPDNSSHYSGVGDLFGDSSTSSSGGSGDGSGDSGDEVSAMMAVAHETFDPDEFNSDTLIVAQAMMAQATTLPGPGSWMSKLASLFGMKKSKLTSSKNAKTKIPLSSKNFQKTFAALFKNLCPPTEDNPCGGKNGPSSRPPNKPPPRHRAVYDPKLWGQLFNNNDQMLVDEVLGQGAFASLGNSQAPPDVETGWLTWDQSEERYPTLDKTLFLHKLKRDAPEGQKGGVWNALHKVLRESKLPLAQRKPLPLGPTTVLALQGLPLSKDTDMYSTVPLNLPSKASDHLMKTPGPSAAPMPLVGPYGTTPAGPPPMPQPSSIPQNTGSQPMAQKGQKGTVASQHKFPASAPAVTTFNQANAQTQSQNSTKKPPSPQGPSASNPPKKGPNKNSQASSAQVSGVLLGKNLVSYGSPASPNVYAYHDDHNTSSKPLPMGHTTVDDFSTEDSESAPSVVTIEDLPSNSIDTDQEYHVTIPGFQSSFPSEEEPGSAASSRRKRSAPYPFLPGSPSKKKPKAATEETFYSSSTSSDSEKENSTSLLSSTHTTHYPPTISSPISTPRFRPRAHLQGPSADDTDNDTDIDMGRVEQVEKGEYSFLAVRMQAQAGAEAGKNAENGNQKPEDVGAGGHRRVKSVRFELESTEGPNETMRQEARRALDRYATTNRRRRGNLLR
ncbi:hypothetical protein F4810DRAFT_724909 [Camillea tinctor]|nr:hypothetical protein F4810DRAFT_724909 [Camillea tinctor]